MNYIPQYIYLALFMLGVGVSLANHGKERKPENFFSTMIAGSIIIALLVWGGFFEGMM